MAESPSISDLELQEQLLSLRELIISTAGKSYAKLLSCSESIEELKKQFLELSSRFTSFEENSRRISKKESEATPLGVKQEFDNESHCLATDAETTNTVERNQCDYIQLVDARWKVPIVLSLRDCIWPEITRVCNLDGLQTLDLARCSQFGFNELDELVAAFVALLQKEYPSREFTIVPTATITPLDEEDYSGSVTTETNGEMEAGILELSGGGEEEFSDDGEVFSDSEEVSCDGEETVESLKFDKTSVEERYAELLKKRPKQKKRRSKPVDVSTGPSTSANKSEEKPDFKPRAKAKHMHFDF